MIKEKKICFFSSYLVFLEFLEKRKEAYLLDQARNMKTVFKECLEQSTYITLWVEETERGIMFDWQHTNKKRGCLIDLFLWVESKDFVI